MLIGIILAGLGGLVVGSFLNTVASRLPRAEALANPGSRCPRCGQRVRPRDIVPVVSWLLLHGRCRDCQAPISRRYPIVETCAALLFAAVVAVHHDDAPALALGLVLVALLVPITLIDLDHRIIPNRITLPAAVIAVGLGTALDPGGEVERLIAGTVAGTLLALPALLHPSGMGLGDAKLAGVMGLYLGAAVAPALLVAFISGTVLGIAIIMRKGMVQGRRTAVPFGPFLAFGGVVGVLAGSELVSLYLSTF